MKTLLLTLPLRLVNESNQRDRWGRIKRAAAQRGLARLLVARSAVSTFSLPMTVTITRVAPKSLDMDGVPSSAKSVRDGIADALGIDDASPDVLYLYRQRRAGVREYAVEVEFREGRACSVCGSRLP